MDIERFGLNASYVEALRAQWVQDPHSVPDEWRSYFDAQGEDDQSAGANGASHVLPSREEVFSRARPDDVPPVLVGGQASVNPGIERRQPTAVRDRVGVVPGASDTVETLRGIAQKIAENMDHSLHVPTAMSSRTMPVKVLEENRRVINSYLDDDARARASFTHIISWAIVRAIQKVPSMNNGYAVVDGKPSKLVRNDINLGLAIDLPGRDGTRTLVVPNLKAVQTLDFRSFLEAYNDLVERGRKNKLGVADYEGTTVSLTNPGGIGTVASAPRLMEGQGTIIAVGAIGFPAEYEATSPDTLKALGIGKVMTATSTYDHRVIQGAESGAFLKHLHELLNGEHGFYDELFSALSIPHHPYRLQTDTAKVTGVSGTERAMKVSQLIHTYRVRGHMLANVDPLDLKPRVHPELALDSYGLTIWDLDREFATLGVLPSQTATFRTILERLRDTYCRRMGCEYMHINDVEERAWFMDRVEGARDALSLDDKRRVLKKLSQAQGFERFLHKRYMGHKRFSVEGAESAIAILDEFLAKGAEHGVTDVLVGMAHRGRLNVLANVMGKSYEAIFAEFEDADPKTIQGSGDVKYHLGARGVYRWRGKPNDFGSVEEREVRIELACNPSHLEAVGPVVMGQTRARQDLIGDRERKKIVAIAVHGDAAFACQGVVYESLQMHNLQGFRVGGTVHLIINNQIGYTTGPERARSSSNASDIARAIQAPVIRVNGDDPEACIKAARIAFDYRMRYRKDVVIDMVCYRRHGHNEGDEPSYTQPILYRAIGVHESVRDRYAALLLRRGDLTQEEVDKVEEQTFGELERAFGAIKERGSEAIPEKAPHMPGANDLDAVDDPDTRVDGEILKRITKAITYDPDVIEIHPRVRKQVLERRYEMVFAGPDGAAPGIDFGMAELLAYGSLLLEGVPVRMSGQDCGRGTFAHRHAILYDVKDGRAYIPLNYLGKTRDEGEEEWHPSRFRIYDSPLSEEAVLGFEYGYSVTHPDSLVLWEAQFGDFFNGAQIQIDQFIVSGEAKWGQRSRVVLMLPHGYDGQGPEHSSARMERFLQLCAEENVRVAICTTSAQTFHLLRRQAKQPKKPLVLFTHKSLLRSEVAASPLAEFSDGHFQTVIDDERAQRGKTPRRVVFCTGKVYWDLDGMRRERAKENAGFGDDVHIVRIEQLHPFPDDKIAEIVSRAKGAELVWLQEEPKNMGAWTFLRDCFERNGVQPKFLGRRAAASPATGSLRRHKAQQNAILEGAFAATLPDPGTIPR
jgi:2-oxoglutarate decarboxylase